MKMRTGKLKNVKDPGNQRFPKEILEKMRTDNGETAVRKGRKIKDRRWTLMNPFG